MTFAIFYGNLELIKHISKSSICNVKKLMKIPGSSNS